MNSVNFVENVNLSEQTDGSNVISSSNVIENLNINVVICNKCKRKVDKLNTKRVFGQKNLYECKGDEFKNCKEMLWIEKIKEEEKIEQEYKKNQKLFEEEYLEYIIKNQSNFIKLPVNFQYRDSNVRYYDPEKKIVFKKSTHDIFWTIDDKLSKINFGYLENKNKESSNESSNESK